MTTDTSRSVVQTDPHRQVSRLKQSVIERAGKEFP